MPAQAVHLVRRGFPVDHGRLGVLDRPPWRAMTVLVHHYERSETIRTFLWMHPGYFVADAPRNDDEKDALRTPAIRKLPVGLVCTCAPSFVG
jgi:hypothetical protein